jgi:hypothetical protein
MNGIAAIARIKGVGVNDLIRNLEFAKYGVEGEIVWSRNAYKDNGGKRTRVCPCCMNERNPYARSNWDLPVTLRCERHGNMLLDKCTTCMRPITHERKYFERCNCGENFCQMSAPPVHPWVWEMEAQFSEAFAEDSYPSVRQQGLRAARILRSFAQAKVMGCVLESGVMRTTGILNSDEFFELERCFQDSKVGFPNEYKWHMLVQGSNPYKSNRLKFLEYFPKVAVEVAKIYSEAVDPDRDLFGLKMDGNIAGMSHPA